MKVLITIVVEKKGGHRTTVNRTVSNGMDAWPWKRTHNKDELVEASAAAATSAVKEALR
jgi:hypothetical protein